MHSRPNPSAAIDGVARTVTEFGRFAAKKRSRRNRRRPETFDFLGFTHICGENRKGGFILMRHSVNKRVQQKLRAVRVELRKRMHRPIAEQGRWLWLVFRGFSQYHAVPTDGRAVNSFRGELARSWYRSLRRRSEKRRINWGKVDRLVKHWIPATRICHPWPNERFDAKHSR
jgi:hypothetical protein